LPCRHLAPGILYLGESREAHTLNPQKTSGTTPSTKVRFVEVLFIRWILPCDNNLSRYGKESVSVRSCAKTVREGAGLMNAISAEQQLAAFIAKFTPEIAGQVHTLLQTMRLRLPGAIELVYDNYNALAIGFSPTERVSEVIFSIAVYPRWVSLFFFQAHGLADPGKLLKGSGKVARHIVLKDPADLNTPAIRALMDQAIKKAVKPLDPGQPHRLVIKSISAKQRPRRPATS
jgi:hypothetical protein